MDDDFEIEEQPQNLRDRVIPGHQSGRVTDEPEPEFSEADDVQPENIRNVSGSAPPSRTARPRRPGGGGRRMGSNAGSGYSGGSGSHMRPPRRHDAPVAGERMPEPESVKPARALLDEILAKMGVTNVEIGYIPRSEGEYFEITGPDLAMLIGRHGNTLEALNLVFNNIINAGVKNNRKYFTIDAEGYRARRADQLKTLALATLERCVREKKPQRLDPMLPSERKIVHLALQDNSFVRTESEGVEPERFVVIFPK
jgi:spoIIIJ-associated protein